MRGTFHQGTESAGSDGKKWEVGSLAGPPPITFEMNDCKREIRLAERKGALVRDQLDMVQFLAQVIDVVVEAGAVDDGSTIVHVNDQWRREWGEAAGVDDGQVAQSPYPGSMCVAEKKEAGRRAVLFDKGSSIVYGSGPVPQGDENPPGHGEELEDHVSLSHQAR